MEVAVYVLGLGAFVAVVVASLLGALFHYRDATIWTSCVAILLAVIGGFCWFQDKEWKKDSVVTSQGPVNYSVAVENGWLSPTRTMEER